MQIHDGTVNCDERNGSNIKCCSKQLLLKLVEWKRRNSLIPSLNYGDGPGILGILGPAIKYYIIKTIFWIVLACKRSCNVVNYLNIFKVKILKIMKNIPVTFSTRLLIRSVLNFLYSHLCKVFCHTCSCP